MINLNRHNFKELADSSKAVIKFGASWCGPCRMIKPVLEKVASSVKGVDFYDIDVETLPEIASKFNVKGIPCIVFLNNNEEVHRIVGMTTIQILEQSALKLKSL